MSVFLPMFPLQLVVFPREKIHLHVFEPRYKQLIHECRDDSITFGIPPYLDGKIVEYGTEMHLMDIVQTYDNGEMDIIAEGVRVFHLHSFTKVAPEKLYPAGTVTFIENDPASEPGMTDQLAAAFAEFHRLLDTGYERDRFDTPSVSFQIAHEVGMTIEQKVHLLAEPKEALRQRLLVQHLNQAIPLLEAAKATERRIRRNGHFVKLPPIDLPD